MALILTPDLIRSNTTCFFLHLTQVVDQNVSLRRGLLLPGMSAFK